MSGMTLVVANGEWPNEDLMQTLIENSEFVIALDGASDRFDAWDVVVGDMDSVEDSSRFEADKNQENSDLAKALLGTMLMLLSALMVGALTIALEPSLRYSKPSRMQFYISMVGGRVGRSFRFRN